MLQQIRRAHYAWVIFVVAFITLLGAAGFRSTPGILIDPLGKEFGWSRATVATAVSINVLLFGFIGPFAAALQLRYGLRKVTMTALAIISTGALATTQMTQPWHLYILWGGVVGVGVTTTGGVLGTGSGTGTGSTGTAGRAAYSVLKAL